MTPMAILPANDGPTLCPALRGSRSMILPPWFGDAFAVLLPLLFVDHPTIADVVERFFSGKPYAPHPWVARLATMRGRK